MKMHAHMLFTTASHPASPLTSHIRTPGICNETARSWVWAAAVGRWGTSGVVKSQALPKGYNGRWLPAENAHPLSN